MSRGGTLHTRFAKVRGTWYAMNTNVDGEQADRHQPFAEWGEEVSVYVPNDLAASAPALVDALREIADGFSPYGRMPKKEALRVARAALSSLTPDSPTGGTDDGC